MTPEKRVERLKNLKRNDTFAYKNVGYGYTTYEEGSDVIETRDGKLFTDAFEDLGMDWTDQTWKFDGGLGLVTTIVLMEDVPEGALEE